VKSSNGHASSGVVVASPIHSGIHNASFTCGVTAIGAVQPGNDDETIKQLRTEIGGLRCEVEALRGLLDRGGIAATDHSSSRAAAISPRKLYEMVSPISADVWHREA